MVARIRRDHFGLIVRFERNGEEPETQRASDGREALFAAVSMLINRAQLMVNDRLTVKAADKADD